MYQTVVALRCLLPVRIVATSRALSSANITLVGLLYSSQINVCHNYVMLYLL